MADLVKYNYLVVGAGLSGATFAYEAARRGFSVLVIDKRNHVGGNCYTEMRHGVPVHVYGAHIFHTDDERVWAWINQFGEFDNYRHTVKVNHKGRIYSFPINLLTINQVFGVSTPTEARELLISLKTGDGGDNFEDAVRAAVGDKLAQTFFLEYTEKQWGCPAFSLPSSTFKRIPIRFSYDDTYFAFDNKYQGIPKGGYTPLFWRMLSDCDYELGVDYFDNRKEWDSVAQKVVYTGPIDKFHNNKFGPLRWRSLRFDHRISDEPDFQGGSVVNYTSKDVPYTRIIDHKHFYPSLSDKSGPSPITYEYPQAWDASIDPYYPIETEFERSKYNEYRKLNKNYPNHLFLGRLADFVYIDMHAAIRKALMVADKEFSVFDASCPQ